MTHTQEVFKLFATTAKGMEPLLAEELRQMGASQVQETRAGVTFEGTVEAAYRACLWSRIANRILLPLKTFDAPNPEKLYGGVKGIKWSDHLSPEDTIAVDFASTHSAITHTHFGALKVKDAIVDQFRSNTGVRPSVDTKRPDIRVNVYVNQDKATVSLDLSGDSLHKRGYREEDAGAPLKENLAAAILMFAGWPAVAKRGGAFVDAMCGSGTLPIEAALMARNSAPGLDRRYYGFMKWKKHDVALWKKLVTEATEAELDDDARMPKIVGYDQDFRAVRIAIENLESAELRSAVHIEKRELNDVEPVETHAEAKPGEPAGIFIVNPPYGERLGDVEELKELYERIGDTMKKKFKGWEGYVFTGSPELAKHIGLKASRRYVLFNGAIECRLLKFELY